MMTFNDTSSAAAGSKGRVLLAYSGGLDTSCILIWLIEQGYEVLAYMANIGQEEDFESAREKALAVGAKAVLIEDLRREFVVDTIFPAVQSNAIYENVYLLGTSLARPVIAKKQIELAALHGCDFVSHGCTGKGNDQVRFELAYYALNPNIKVIAPWRESLFYTRFQGRADLLAYAAEKGIPVFQTKDKPWSTDENLFHISFEAGILEDPSTAPPKDMWKLTVDPEDAPDVPEIIKITFSEGVPVKVETAAGAVEDPLELFILLNTLGRKHGIGRIDIVENRFIGIKSRGCYETPGGSILRTAHMDLEGLTLDREVRRLRDLFSTKLGEILYNGFWFSPEREFLMQSILWSQKVVNGTVSLKLYKGAVYVLGRTSPNGLYDKELSSMDIAGGFEPLDSTGFIRVQRLRLVGWEKAQVKMKEAKTVPL